MHDCRRSGARCPETAYINGWNGRPARSGRRLADRKSRTRENTLGRVLSWTPTSFPSGDPPDGKGQWPVPPVRIANSAGGCRRNAAFRERCENARFSNVIGRRQRNGGGPSSEPPPTIRFPGLEKTRRTGAKHKMQMAICNQKLSDVIHNGLAPRTAMVWPGTPGEGS
jgi:hypothetical protein